MRDELIKEPLLRSATLDGILKSRCVSEIGQRNPMRLKELLLMELILNYTQHARMRLDGIPFTYKLGEDLGIHMLDLNGEQVADRGQLMDLC